MFVRTLKRNNQIKKNYRKKVVENGSVDYKLHGSDDLESLGFEFLHERVGWFRIEDDSIGCEEDAAGDDPAAYLACTLRADGMVKGFLKIVESLEMSAEIVYDKSYSPDDGLISSHELLHPIKVIKITRSTPEKSAKLSDLIFF